jgi:UDP-glucose 4-epimerase
MGKILVTGGAGYIGSHIVRRLEEEGDEVVVVDDLSQGHRAAVAGVSLVVADFGDPEMLEREMGSGGIEFVVHMAAFCEVGQSMLEPAAYYANNLARSLSLLEQARRHGVRGIVFSSTAAVYGEPVELPITEAHPQQPTNPYGETKRAFEQALQWYHRAYGLRYVALRYFNAAGAHPRGDIGEDHSPETHLLPKLFHAVQHDSEPMPIFGDDYPTEDGTCVRDYIHVIDLAEAHRLAIESMRRDDVVGESFNLGNGKGFSVREVVDVVGRVTGKRPPIRMAPRRPGDPARLVASSARIAERLGWKPSFPGLEQITQSAWEWHRRHPDGYGDAT